MSTRITARRVHFAARRESRIILRETSGYMERIAAEANVMPAAKPMTIGTAFINKISFQTGVCNLVCPKEDMLLLSYARDSSLHFQPAYAFFSPSLRFW